jgi:Protein of unknown function (DUF3152)
MVSGETIRRVLSVTACAVVLAACAPTAAPRFVAGAPASPPAASLSSPDSASPRSAAPGSVTSGLAVPAGTNEHESRVLGVQFPPMTPEVDEFVTATSLTGSTAPTSVTGLTATTSLTGPTATKEAPIPFPGGVHEHAPLPIPASGTRTFTSATGGTPRVGDGSTLVTYKVQLEGGILAWTPEKFADKVDAVLADTRSWRAAHTWSFQRVGPDITPSLYIRLATRNTVDYYCGLAGVNTQGKYSCRYGKYVMINLDRWMLAVPGFGVDLEGYRAMVTNHEVGHFLGYHHQACPAAGRLAPVMQTQTIALNGCLPNSWPYPDGVHFVSGPPAPA